MKKVVGVLLLVGLVSLPCTHEEKARETVEPVELTIYRIAAWITGCPEYILRGYAFTESTNDPFAIGDDGNSIGLCQLDERHHTERVALIGREYNPRCPLDSLIVACALYMHNLAILGTERAAIAAHRQGVHGVQRDGIGDWYVDRVWRYGCTLNLGGTL